MALESPRPFLMGPGAVPATASEAVRGPARAPTGVPDLDYLTGGVPAGSVILLLGEPGAGHPEFALTSAVHLMLHREDPSQHRIYLGTAPGPFVYPDGILYVSLTRSREQILDEARAAFDSSYPDALTRHLTFRDLSSAYFADTVVPSAWAAVPSPLLGGGPRGGSADAGPLAALANALEPGGQSNLVIVDSLTDLLVRRGVEPGDLLTLVKGLRRRAKEWGGIVYLLLSQGVAAPATEEAIIDSVDAVFAFRWTTAPNRTHRQRVLLIEKSMPVLAHLAEEYQGRFVVRVHHLTGLVTTQHERI